jgi:hypothetical protein
MRPTRRRLLAISVATGATALAAPASGASAAGIPPLTPIGAPPLGLPSLGGAAIGVGGNQIGTAGCVGTNRPAVGGNNGSTSAQTCGAVLSFQGAQIGQISAVIGPTIIGSPNTLVYESAGSITGVP